jgi:hypothetical protein
MLLPVVLVPAAALLLHFVAHICLYSAKAGERYILNYAPAA